MAGLAVDPDVSAALPYDAVNRRQSEASARATGDRVERLEKMQLHLRVDTRAGIADRQQDVDARLDVDVLSHIRLGQHDPPGLDDHRAAARHRVARVRRQIEDRALNLTGIDMNRRKPIIGSDGQVDVLADDALEHGGHLSNRGVEINVHRTKHLAPGVGEQLAGQLRRPQRSLVRFACVLPLDRLLGSCAISSSDDIRMTVRRLLKLCATPPASRPIASVCGAS